MLIRNSPVADPGSTFATKSGLDDETSRFLIEMSLPALATIVLDLAGSPAVGFAALLIGAIGFHAKAGDYSDPKTRMQAMSPFGLFVVAAVAAVMLALTMSPK